MIKVYKEIEEIIKMAIYHNEHGGINPKVNYTESTCAQTFEKVIDVKSIYDSINIDLSRHFLNVQSLLKKDIISVKISIENLSEIFYADLDGMFIVQYTKNGGCKIFHTSIGHDLSMKGIFVTIKSYYDSGRIIKEIGTCCHNYMLHLYDVVEYYSDDNKFSYIDIALKDHKFTEWVDSNEIDIYSISDEQKMMFDFEKGGIYESFPFSYSI